MVNKPKGIGTACETAIVRYLNIDGFPQAERSALHGNMDRGDITGTPGIAWESKGGKAAETASDAQIMAWLSDTEVERQNASAAYGVLVTKRAGIGPNRAGEWWAHFYLGALVRLTAGPEAVVPAELSWQPVRMHLRTAVRILRAAGYGDLLPPQLGVCEGETGGRLPRRKHTPPYVESVVRQAYDAESLDDHMRTGIEQGWIPGSVRYHAPAEPIAYKAGEVPA